MADTNHSHSSEIPIEGDGVSYTGIGWFVVVLVVTVVGCELFVTGLFKATEHYRLNRPGIVRAPLAAPPSRPTIEAGRLATGMEAPPQPALLVDEPTNLRAFRDAEQKALHGYGWVNQGAGTVRLPIDRAKELVLERHLLPARDAAPASSAAPSGTLSLPNVPPAGSTVETSATPAPAGQPEAGHAPAGH